MEQIVVKFIESLNVPQLLAMGAIVWFFYMRAGHKSDELKKDLKEKIDADINKVNERIDTVNERIDRLSNKIDDIDRRLCRIEGSLATQGHCLFAERTERKIE